MTEYNFESGLSLDDLELYRRIRAEFSGGGGGGISAPTGGVPVFATEDQAVADAYPDYVWLILDPTGGDGGGGGVTPPPADTTAPTVPTGLTATPGDAQVALSWAASTDAVGVTGYRVYRGGTLIASPTGTSYTDTGRTNGVQYSYTVAAADAAGNVSAQTSAVTATPAAPPAPGGGAPTLVASATTITSTGWTPTRAITLPTGIQAGDVLVMLLHGNLDPVYGVTPPAGWTDRDPGTGVLQDVRLFTATATGSEGATINVDVANAPEQTGVIVYQLRNVAETPAAIAKAEGFVISLPVPTLTGVDADAIVLTGLGESSDYDAADPVTGPGAGWTVDGNLTHARQEIYAHRTGTGAGTFASTNGGKFRAVAAAFQ